MTSNGTLYIVATPIGNLQDMSPRAVETLNTADLILAEDTRHSAPLLKHFQINTPTKSFHEHNENQISESICQQLQAGKNIALISDAGTPLISDPGFPLLKLAHEKYCKIVSIPGPCAAITAIAASGMPVARFSFEGFLPQKSEARKKALLELRNETRTLIFYESPHRVAKTVEDMCEVLGEQRQVTLGRELTKLFETILHTTLAELKQILATDANQSKGEIVLVVEGAREIPADTVELEIDDLLQRLLTELPLKKAVQIVVGLTGKKKNDIYKRALELQA